MSHTFKYNTATDAVEKLRELGFTADFTLNNGFIYNSSERFAAEDIRIIYTSRYEGDSDPADETTVYGLETTTGLKGILVTADGIYSDRNTRELLQQLHLAKLNTYTVLQDSIT